MPRGSRSGSIIIVPAVRGLRGRILEPEKIFVRRRYRDPQTGKLREKKRRVESRTEAKEKLHELRDEIKRERLFPITHHSSPITFAQLAAHYEKHFLHPPDRNGNGLKSWRQVTSTLKTLKTEFGDEPLRAIDYERIDDFRIKLAGTKTRAKKTRGITSVNRHLELLRRLLNIARRKPLKWISENPFADGEPLTRRSKEVERMRILTHKEETALLAFVKSAGDRVHAQAIHYQNLYSALIFAIDTAMRAGEQFKTRVSDVHLEQEYIRTIGKRNERRIVPISKRLRRELLQLKPIKRSLRRRARARSARIPAGGPQASLPASRDELIFDFRRPKNSFANACQKVGIDDFRWHDLRHTGIMRMLEAGVDPATVMKITGHTSWTTFMRYVNLNPELVRGVAAKMDQRRRKRI